MNYSGGTSQNIQLDNSGNAFAGGSTSSSSFLIKYSQSGGPVTIRDIIPIEHLNQVKLYPNPAINQVIIRNEENKVLGYVTIYDVSEKKVYQQFVENTQTVINLHRFTPGVYYLRSEQTSKAIKFVKQ